MSFLDFVVNRHAIWECRQFDLPQPWTQDPILASKKFTNVFRVLDPGTQFLFTDLYPDADPWDQLLRAFLYRHTGRIEAWQYAQLQVGEYPTTSNLDDVLEAFKEFRGDHTMVTRKRRWSKIEQQPKYQRTVFTSAYLVFPQSSEPGTDKLESIIDLTKRVFTQPGFLEDWASAKTSAARFRVLRSFKGVGDFMSMQILTDWNYTQLEDYESDWVQPGPGAVKGLKATGYATVKQAWEDVLALPNCPTLDSGRKPSLMDVQNCLCEYSKYHRYSLKPEPTGLYTPVHPGEQPDPILPAYY